MITSKTCTWTIIPLIIFLFIHSVPLHSQNKGIVIKDSVAIFPHNNPVQVVTTEDWAIEVTIYWESTGGTPWRVLYDHYISRYYGACHSNAVFFNGQNPFTFSVNRPRVGEYEFTVDAFAGRITKVIIKDTGLPDYTINNPNFVFKYITPYYSGFRFEGDTTQVQNLLYENAYYELGSFVEEKRCDAETRFLFSGTPEITYRITQGAEYASLAAVDLFKHILLGDTYNARIYDDIPGVAANGKLPPDSGALVIVEASIASFTAQMKFMVRPYYYALKGPAAIMAGEEASIQVGLVDWLGREHDRSAGARTQIILADSNNYGELHYRGWRYDPETDDDIFVDERGDTLNGLSIPQNGFTFVSTKANVPDTVQIPLVMKKTGEGRWIWAEYWFQVPYPGEDTVQNEVKLTVLPKESPFDHFQVTAEPDTLAHGTSVTITALAKDGENNDAELDGNTLLTFTIDSTQYGSFISATGDTVPSSLENILYSDAKEGKIKFTANKINPIGLTPRKVTITVTKADDATKDGKGNLCVKEFVKIKIALDKTELKPLGNSDKKDNPNYNPKGPDKRKKIIDFSKVNKAIVTITVTDRFDKPVKDYKFAIKALVRNQSGGHDHTANRPTGKFITAKKDTLVTVLDTTKADGKVKYTYLCSGFGGVDSLYLRGTTDKDTATAVLILKMGEFEELKAGTHYNLIGSTTTHVINHFGTSNTIQKLKALADSAHADSSWTLQYNDISLINGGPFDVSMDHLWDTPHETHREGNHVDMRSTTTAGSMVSTQWLEDIFKNNNWGKIQEELKGQQGHHFHLTIY